MKKILSLVFVLALLAINSYAVRSAFDVYNEGYDLYSTNNYKGALSKFKQCIKMMPDFVKPYNKAGLALIALKETDHAIVMYKQAVYIDPNYAEAWYNYGVAYEIKDPKNIQKHIELYQKAISLKNDDHIFVRASLNLAKINRLQKNYDDAILLLRNAVKIEPEFCELYNESGLCYYETDLLDKAQDNFSKALSLKRDYKEASTNLALTYQKQGHLAKALIQLEDTLKIDKDFDGAQYSYGNALIASGYYDQAIAHLKTAIALKPKFPEAFYSLGKAYLHKDMFAESQEAFKKALQLNRNYTLAREAYEAVKKTRNGFTDHIVFRKILAEGEEASSEGEDVALTAKQIEENKQVAKQQLDDQKKRQREKDEKVKEVIKEKKQRDADMETVEDLRVPDDKPKKIEGEDTSDSEGNTTDAEEF